MIVSEASSLAVHGWGTLVGLAGDVIVASTNAVS